MCTGTAKTASSLASEFRIYGVLSPFGAREEDGKYRALVSVP